MTLRVIVARASALTVLMTIVGASDTAAQQTEPSRLALDTVVAVDTTVTESGDASTGLVADAVASIDFGRGVQFVTRPFIQRLAGSGEWNAQVWLAAVRYERTQRVSIRIDTGYIPSPTGLANLFLRPHTNPTIALPGSLFATLPRVEPGAPRTTLLGPMYPLGVSATVSSLKWDLRAAVIDTSPTRTRRVFSDGSPPNPPRFANVVIGGGVTPIVGVRIGASLTRGGWKQASETPLSSESRQATITTIEGDLSFRYTRVQAEWTRDSFDTTDGNVVARGWFAQGMQTLSPRWFVAGRAEQLLAPAVVGVDNAGLIRQRQRFRGVEETLGYRLTPELTLRLSHRARTVFGRGGIDHTGAVSIVWWRRWR